MGSQSSKTSWRRKALYSALKWAVCLLIAASYFQSARICPPAVEQLGAPAGSCYYSYENLIPVVGFLLFAVSPWPLAGALLAFIAGHFLTGLVTTPFTMAVLTDRYPGSLLRDLGVPAPGGVFYLRLELLLILLWALVESALRAMARARRS